MDKTLFRHWWLLLLRGVFAILFAGLTFFRPVSSLFALVLMFGIYAVVDGASNLALSLKHPRAATHWGTLSFEGILGLVAGLVTLVWPAISAFALLMVIAVWAVTTGITSVVAAIRLRRQIKKEWLLALNGVLSIALGVVLFLYPGPGALALVLWIGAYALVSGVVLIALAFRVRSWERQQSDEKPGPHAPLHPAAPV
jgi:uncharacterized membrane protein HdeD (DUF308 family)